MVKISKIKAFSFVEAIVSMLILMIVSMGALPVLTKAKAPIETITIRGQYGCWNEPGKGIVEWYLDERTPRTDEPQTPTYGCKLKLDKRPGHFYILASGDGTANLPGQVSTLYTAAISNELDINLDGTTTVSFGASAEVTAHGGGQVFSSGVVPENIKSCKFLSGPCGTSCSYHAVPTSNGDGSVESYTPSIIINGCPEDTIKNEFGDIIAPTIALSTVSYSGAGGGSSFYNVDSGTRTAIAKANGYQYSGSAQVGTSTGSFTFNLEFHDSSYTTPEKMANFSSNGSVNPAVSEDAKLGGGTIQKSKMRKILDEVSVRRKSVLIEKMQKANPGAPGKKGAVLILW